MGIYGPFDFLRSVWRYGALVRRLTRRKIELRYRGSFLGFLWAVVNPLLLLAVYTFVFSTVFKARWGDAGEGTAEFSLYLYSGILLYSVFAECVNEAPTLMRQNTTFVKQHRFPLEILPWVSLMATLFNFAIGIAVLSVFHFAVLGPPPLSALYVPLVMAPVVLATLGVGWLLAALGVFLRDITQVVGVMTTALLFLSPIFYPASRIPEAWREHYFLNPFARIIEMSKVVLFEGSPPAWAPLGVMCLGGWLIAWFGFACFMKSKPAFADVV